MYRIYKKILHSYEGDFKSLVKSGTACFKRNFTVHFRELPENERGITCMKVQSPNPSAEWTLLIYRKICHSHISAKQG